MSALRLTLRQLQIFAAVAHAGSTAAAGSAIGLSQSATSAAIKELERLLAQPLFDRSGKRLLLNSNGRALLPRALALLEGAHDIERLASGQDTSPASLRIGASTTIGNYVLPGLLPRLWGADAALQAPEWHAQVMVGNTERVCDAVADFTLDLGLIEGPCHDPQLDVQPWLRDELVVVASPTRLARLTAGAAVPLNVLRQQVWLLREAGSGTRAATDQVLLPHLHAWRRSVELGNSEAIKHAAAEGLGLACLSEWVVADAIAAGRLVHVPTALPRMLRQCHLVLHRHKQPTAGLQRLTAALVADAPQRANAPAGRHWPSPPAGP